jgi:predicted transglutaminase-like cysteine proteinase
LSLVNQWITELRAIPYSYSMEWKTPNEIAHAPTADCKGKAVALYQRMRENGACNLRLVIGKRTPVSRSTHTWVEWRSASVTFVLDPTINWFAQAVNEIPENSYVPYYAYAGGRKYRAAPATSLYARL